MFTNEFRRWLQSVDHSPVAHHDSHEFWLSGIHVLLGNNLFIRFISHSYRDACLCQRWQQQWRRRLFCVCFSVADNCRSPKMPHPTQCIAVAVEEWINNSTPPNCHRCYSSFLVFVSLRGVYPVSDLFAFKSYAKQYRRQQITHWTASTNQRKTVYRFDTITIN